MTVTITRSQKSSLTLTTPVMPASGVFGYGDEYRDLVQLDKLGALVTNPITFGAWSPSTGTRVVPLDSGVLVHTGLPNPGLNKTITAYRAVWSRLPIPVIVHVIVTNAEEAKRAALRIEEEDSIAAVEFGIADEQDRRESARQIKAFVELSEKSLIARLPFGASADDAAALIDAGAGAVVIYAPPRGTARDAGGRLIAGRVYSPVIKPLVLRAVGQIVRRVDAPVIGAGGIHSAADARDYLEAGAVAVQVDSLVWVEPKMLEVIARDLGGLVITQPVGALPDEWYPGMGETERRKRISDAPTKEDP